MTAFRHRARMCCFAMAFLPAHWAGATSAKAAQVPAHLASMPAKLYREAGKALDDPKMSPDRRVAAEHAVETLERAHTPGEKHATTTTSSILATAKTWSSNRNRRPT